MKHNEKDTKKHRNNTQATAGSLLLFDEFDNSFADFLSRRWSRPSDLEFSYRV
ncbi:MAG: hypothetical protein LUQ29_08455 [Methylococcaceae bacterium]|jgi:hypothetical protein|nr:hypothetical protein [Methylococcaceae bacterium]